MTFFSIVIKRFWRVRCVPLIIVSHGLFALPQFDVKDFGAVGNGANLDTKAIQAAIDSCHRAGGGNVYLAKGTFLSGTIYLKSNVDLFVEKGATLLGSKDLSHYPSISSQYPSYTGEYVTNKAFIYAENAENISIEGQGIINGSGDAWIDGPYGFPSFSLRPRIIHFRGCENVQIRNVTLKNSASWVQSYQSCKNMVIDGVTVDSRENMDIEKPRYADAPGRNTDGLDLVDCQYVRISNCWINSGDDAICLKSFSPDEACRYITITNCIVSSNASGIKIGTETAGAFEDITINNCVVYDTRAEGIAILTTDGARIERINISNITLRNIKGGAIVVRLGNRNRTYRDGETINTPSVKGIIIENIQGKQISSEYACSIVGMKNNPIENVTIRNIILHTDGGESLEHAGINVPEADSNYPSGRMYGKLPCFGFYLRHVKNMVMDNVHLTFEKEDQRPAIIAENVQYMNFSNIRIQGAMNSPGFFRLNNAQKVTIRHFKPLSPADKFLWVGGETTSEIDIMDNDFRQVNEIIRFETDDLRTKVKIINNLE
ncbi:MAG: glycoside hydrolase family 28 protein [Cyclobacteriaceae bacterium]|nr:glycoside hydrolase family 28 protein [Cyclobacteriaceae bacterium]